jgi:hypothetical protein
VSAELGRKSNWSDSADLEMMFRGAYSSEFYRALAEAMHTEVRGCAVDNGAAWARVRELERGSARPPVSLPILREGRPHAAHGGSEGMAREKGRPHATHGGSEGMASEKARPHATEGMAGEKLLGDVFVS